ncbi:hypothetical protein [Paraburkholderia lycopersici]|uniref:hypothetical protein n=1 Tax=Paraburkholderia lycopersici TaxID=416944 RepID=UPI0011610CC0|nr:hypothetical protein [Paraburkholderia lycopersici]
MRSAKRAVRKKRSWKKHLAQRGGAVANACLAGVCGHAALARRNAWQQEKRRWRSDLHGCAAQKHLHAPKNTYFRCEFFETLVVIGFALRYHSKRRPGKRQHGRCGTGHTLAAATRKRRGAPGPSLLDGAARVRIIGAFALFVST